MVLTVKCPNSSCGRTYTVSADDGKRIARCKHCGSRFPIGGAAVETLGGHHDSPTGTVAPTSGKPHKVPSPPPKCIGRFEIRQQLGAGAFGIVYRAFDPLLQRDVAIKIPRMSTQDQAAVARFLREPKAAAQLRHPHIVPVYDAGVEGKNYYIASAYIDGQTLDAAMEQGELDRRRAAQIVMDLAEALDYAHKLGIVHRDVKPSNVMLDQRGDALLMDFGLARIETEIEKLTHDGAVLGTPAYMAPEQASKEFGEVGPPADQYSLGVVLYELLCGQRPFGGPPAALIFQALHEPAPSPRTLHKDIPLDLETICLKAMAKQPGERYAGCGELAADLRRWLEDRPIVARPMSVLEQCIRWSRKRPTVAALVVLVVVLAATSTSVAIKLLNSRHDLEAAVTVSKGNAERAERSLSRFKREMLARQSLQSQLEVKQRAILTQQQDLRHKETELKVRDATLVRKDSDLKQKDHALSSREKELKETKTALVTSETVARQHEQKSVVAQQDAIAARELVDSHSWAVYAEKIIRAQAALKESKLKDAATWLSQCPEEHRSWEWDYFHNQLSPREYYTWSIPVKNYVGANDRPPRFQSLRVLRLDLSPDRKRILARIGPLQKLGEAFVLIDATTGGIIADLRSYGWRGLQDATFGPDAQHIVTAEKTSLTVWKLGATPRPAFVSQFDLPRGMRVQYLIGSRSGKVLAAFCGRSVCFVDTLKARQIERIDLAVAAINPGSPQAALFGPSDTSVMIRSSNHCQFLDYTKPGLLSVGSQATLTRDASLLVGRGEILDTSSARRIPMVGDLGGTPIDCSPDGKRIACLDYDGRLSLVDTAPLNQGVCRTVIRFDGEFPWIPYVRKDDFRYVPGVDGPLQDSLIFSNDWKSAYMKSDETLVGWGEL